MCAAEEGQGGVSNQYVPLSPVPSDSGLVSVPEAPCPGTVSKNLSNDHRRSASRQEVPCYLMVQEVSCPKTQAASFWSQADFLVPVALQGAHILVQAITDSLPSVAKGLCRCDSERS